jgi:hypothetical protein
MEHRPHVHRTPYQLLRGVRGGTKCRRSPHCLQYVKEVVSCRNFNNVLIIMIVIFSNFVNRNLIY